MKRVALIDNATLTATQRLLGKIQVKNLYNIDGDIAAFEGLLQSLLFFDDVRSIDDYKEAYRSSREKQFDFIKFIPKQDIEYDFFLGLAKESTAKVMFSVRGREIADEDFKTFFDLLKTHLVFNWQMASSTYYLTVALLTDDSGISVEKYGALQAMISSQLWGENENPKSDRMVTVSDRSGHRLPPTFSRGEEYSLGSQVENFGAALNWLALKTAFYVHIAEAYGMDVVLHPIRHAFLVNQINKTYRLSASVYDSVTEMLTEGISGTVREINRISDPILYELKLPLWSAFLATKTNDPADFLDICQHLRIQGPFVEARAQLDELQQLEQDGERAIYVTKVNKLNLALAGVSKRLLSKYGISSPQGIATSPIVNFAIKAKTGLSLPLSTPKIPIPRKLIGLTDNRGFRGVFRSVVSDLTSIERLGALHGVITSNVNRDRSAKKSSVSQETSEWLGRNSSWKKWL